MVAVDANVILRLLLRDVEPQWQAAHDLFSSERIFVPISVWLEVEWVMRSVYNLARSDFLEAARYLIGLENVDMADRSSLTTALGWTEQGMDFADALHLASAGAVRRFATFDRDFRSRANRVQNRIEVITP